MGFIRVHFVRYVRQGMWGGPNEDLEVGWHGPRGGYVGDVVDVRNVDQNHPFLDSPALLTDRGRFYSPPLAANRHKKGRTNFVYTLERSQLSEQDEPRRTRAGFEPGVARRMAGVRPRFQERRIGASAAVPESRSGMRGVAYPHVCPAHNKNGQDSSLGGREDECRLMYLNNGHSGRQHCLSSIFGTPPSGEMYRDPR